MAAGSIFSPEEREALFALAEALTGACHRGRHRREVLTTNVYRRMSERGVQSFVRYLQLVEKDPGELEHLISALTIHTTGWFRERDHFTRIDEWLSRRDNPSRPIRVLCAACSSGEEVYSCGLLFESRRRHSPQFDYHIIGLDIDPKSIERARSGIYPLRSIDDMPEQYRKLMLEGVGPSSGLCTPPREIRARCQFVEGNLMALDGAASGPFDIVICRNVLIYFRDVDVERIVSSLISRVSAGGLLCLGHSEAIDARKYGLALHGGSIYSRPSEPGMSHESSKVRGLNLLVVDDSPTICKTIRSLLKDTEFVVHEALSAVEATALLKKQPVDLVSLDLNMPGMTGKEWLQQQRAQGLRVPVVIMSDAAPHEAADVLGVLERGAQDFIQKSTLSQDRDLLVERLRALAKGYETVSNSVLSSSRIAAPPLLERADLIVIGASTGGTEVLLSLLKQFPQPAPPILVVQHIVDSFAKTFAARLAQAAGLSLGVPEEGVRLLPSHLYLAHGDYHIGVRQRGSALALTVSSESPRNHHRPSVDYLFSSAARVKNKKVVGILLTGMGVDGARGLLELKSAGATTFAQDETSCTVFGMPREAIKLGAAHYIGPPAFMREALEQMLRKESSHVGRP